MVIIAILGIITVGHISSTDPQPLNALIGDSSFGRMQGIVIQTPRTRWEVIINVEFAFIQVITCILISISIEEEVNIAYSKDL